MAVIRFGGGGGGASVNVAANSVLVSNAAGTGINAASTSNTEIGYLVGATSNIQAQINTKIAAPTIVSTTWSADQTVSVGTAWANAAQIGSISLSVTATGNPILLSFFGSTSSGSSGSLMVGYQLDSATPQNVTVITSSAQITQGCFLVWLTGVSAGAHTIKLFGNKTNNNVTVYGNAGAWGTNGNTPKFEACVF